MIVEDLENDILPNVYAEEALELHRPVRLESPEGVGSRMSSDDPLPMRVFSNPVVLPLDQIVPR